MGDKGEGDRNLGGGLFVEQIHTTLNYNPQVAKNIDRIKTLDLLALTSCVNEWLGGTYRKLKVTHFYKSR